MKVSTVHTWVLAPDEARRLQETLCEHLLLAWDGRPVDTVAGVDVSYSGDHARAAIVVLRFPDMAPLAAVTAEVPLTFSYVPGLLAFREGPAVLAAWEKLPLAPDLLLFDGHGIAHPRGIGLAAHLGLWLDKPAIGVAKSRLYGRHAGVGSQAGDRSELYDEREPGRVTGAALRTRQNAKPVYVSPGHLIDVEHAVTFVLACCRGCRLPEPTRLAHRAAGGRSTVVDC